MLNNISSGNFSFLLNKRNELTKAFRMVFAEALDSYTVSKESAITSDDIIGIYEQIIGESQLCPDMSLATFCSEFANRFADNFSLLFSEIVEADEVPYPQVAYLKNTFTDKAYRKFSQAFGKISAAYFPGFREVCEEVYYGRCSHAILPIYSSTDGQLPSFKKLLVKYDLKIVCATDIEMSDESVMRYALLRKGSFDLENVKHPEYLDVSIMLDGEFGFGTFLAACESLGAVIKSSTSHPMEYSETGELFSIVFNVKNADLLALYLFFECSHIRYTVEGLYNII